MRACASRAPARGLNESFTVRKISYGEGVERVFPLYSPMVDSIKVVRRGKVRRAKLYYLRGLRGKKARITEKQDHVEAADVIAASRRRSSRMARAPSHSGRAALCAGWRLFLALRTAKSRERVTGSAMASPARSTTRSGTTMWSTQQPDGTCLLYIDRHLVHEVTSPQAFEGLRLTGRKVRAPEKTLAVVDHNIPTSDRNLPNPDPESTEQIARDGGERARTSASNISTSTIRARASCTSSGRSRASRCPAPRSCAATATPRRMARSARSRTASARPRSSMCWRRRR